MTRRPRGLYEVLLTDLLAHEVEHAEAGRHPDVATLRDADAADRIALHIAAVVERAIEALPEDERAAAGASIARHLIGQISADVDAPALGEDHGGPAGRCALVRAPRATRRIHARSRRHLPSKGPLHALANPHDRRPAVR